jgi:single-strand DNA-binding protein
MFHTIIIVGNVGRDPDMRYTPTGQAVTTFSVASSRNYTNSQGTQVKETIWFKVNVWGKQAETCSQYIKKGSKVLVEGRLQPDLQSGGPKVFQRQDQTWGSSYEVTGNVVRFLTPKNETGGSMPVGEEGAPMEEAAGDDNIPF